MKLLKCFCGAIITVCLICLTITPFAFDKGTITFTHALQAVAIIMMVFLAAIGTYIVADGIKDAPDGGNR